MPEPDPVVIIAAARTPIGGFQGDFKDLAAANLGAVAAKAVLARSGVASEQIDELILGCVLPAGQGQAPARQAALAAGLTETTH
jgi:acetyl-CoA C-acetyltransferase